MGIVDGIQVIFGSTDYRSVWEPRGCSGLRRILPCQMHKEIPDLTNYKTYIYEEPQCIETVLGAIDNIILLCQLSLR